MTPTKDSAPAREDADDAAYERAFSIGDQRLAPSVPPPPPLSPRNSFVTVRELAFLAAAAMISAFAVMIVYPRTPVPEANKAATVATAPNGRQLASAPSEPAQALAAAHASVTSDNPAGPTVVAAAAPPLSTAVSSASPPAAAPATAVQRPGGPTVRGVTDKEVLFGMAAPLTGAAKELGRQMKLGVETAFNAVNETGGVHGRQLRLVAMDDGYEPTRTATVMKDLYEKNQVFGIVGNVGTPTAVVAVPYALERKMLSATSTCSSACRVGWRGRRQRRSRVPWRWRWPACGWRAPRDSSPASRAAPRTAFLFADASAKAEASLGCPVGGQALVVLARVKYAQGDSDGALAVLASHADLASEPAPSALEGKLLYEQALAKHLGEDGRPTEEGGKLLERAAETLARALARPEALTRAEAAGARITRAYALHRVGDLPGASAAYEAAHLAEPERLAALRGLQSLCSGDLDAYRRALKNLLAEREGDQLASAALAQFHVGRKAFDDALEVARARIDAAPMAVDGYTLLGRVLLAAERRAEAESAFRRAHQVDPASRDGLAGLESVGAAWMATDVERGISVYEGIFRLLPDDPFVRNNLGFLLREAVTPFTTMEKNGVQRLKPRRPPPRARLARTVGRGLRRGGRAHPRVRGQGPGRGQGLEPGRHRERLRPDAALLRRRAGPAPGPRRSTGAPSG